MAKVRVIWGDKSRPLYGVPGGIRPGQVKILDEKHITFELMQKYGDWLTIYPLEGTIPLHVGGAVEIDLLLKEPTLELAASADAETDFITPQGENAAALQAADAMPDDEWMIPANTTAGGQSWTRVTSTDFGWAFTYRFGNRIKLRAFDNTLTGSAGSQTFTGYSTDVTVDVVNGGTFTHDEPDISFHPATNNLLLCWNDRTNTTTFIMDQRYRTYRLYSPDQSPGVSPTMTSDLLATHTTLQSQWRPLITPMNVGANAKGWLVSFTGNHKDSAFMTRIKSSPPWTSPVGSPPTADVQMAPTISINRQVDQDAIEIPGSGEIFAVWHEVQGKGQIRWRLFKSDWTPVTAGFTQLPLSLPFAKSEPRVKYHNNRIWITYHHNYVSGGEYEGIDVYGTVLSYDSPASPGVSGTIATVKPEFIIHPQFLPGHQRKPEMILWGAGEDARALVVYEHYPRGSITPGNHFPDYVGGSAIVGRVFDLDGTPLMNTFRVSTQVATNSGALQFMLRPDIEKSEDETEAIVCWTASASSNIYSVPTGGRLWARRIDLTALP